MDRNDSEIKHFTHLEHIFWGAKTIAGQRRFDRRFELFCKFCKPATSTKILETGCGDGEFTKRLISLPCQIVASDVTPVVLDRGRKYFGSNNKKLIFKIEDAENLSFRDGFFDIVCGASILHHVDVTQAAKEAFRVLKKKGQIFFTEPNLLNPHLFLGLKIPFFRKKMEFSPNETALIRWRVERILKEVGFSKVIVKNYDFLHPSTPKKMIKIVEELSDILEKIPFIKEISGSLLIWARK